MADDPAPPCPIEPQVRAFVEAVLAQTAQRGQPANLAHRRRIAEEVRAPWAAGGPAMARIEDREIGIDGRSVRLRLFEPHGAVVGGPALVYLHGGGWTLFSLETHDRLMREYAAGAGARVVGLDYSLSPEAKFPRALGETAGVLSWLALEGESLGIDPARLVVGGDSAGANLALAAAIQRRDEGEGAPLAGLLLNYGVFTPAISEAALARHGGPGAMLTGEEMADFWLNYLASATDADNPLAAPIRAELHGLPPTFMAIAECDILAEQNLAMARRLREAGIETTAVVYPGATHSFLEAASISPVSRRAIAEACAWLRRSAPKAWPKCDRAAAIEPLA